MRVKRLKCVTFTFVVLNLISAFLLWRYISLQIPGGRAAAHTDAGALSSEEGNVTVPTLVTVVLYDFEEFDHDVPATVLSFLSVHPNLPIVVVTPQRPYPPLKLTNATSVRLVVTEPRMEGQHRARNPFAYIHTEYVLLVPDSTRLDGAHQIRQMVNSLKESFYTHYTRKVVQSSTAVVAARFSGAMTKCFELKVNLRRWTLEYNDKSDFRRCDALTEKQVVLISRQHLEQLPDPLVRPFPEALYVQTAARGMKVRLLKNVVFQGGRSLFTNTHKKWKHDQLKPYRMAQCYRSLGVKNVITESGEEEWYGCKRDTPRCFQTVFNDMPDYLFMGRWTPPCCLGGLRKTAQHVIQILEESGVRYWLEGGSLLGAARDGDIIPWDYDVDLGMYHDDIAKCRWLASVRHANQPVTDDGGFVWEKAREGDFYRVYYSHVNRLHVDIFPFRAVDGVMTKDTWFANHRQDMEFAESFVDPLGRIEFVGMDASAPNDVRGFLELKFGKGVIENPQYPNPNMLVFPSGLP